MKIIRVWRCFSMSTQSNLSASWNEVPVDSALKCEQILGRLELVFDNWVLLTISVPLIVLPLNTAMYTIFSYKNLDYCCFFALTPLFRWRIVFISDGCVQRIQRAMKSTIVSTDDFKMSGLCEGCDNQITAIAQAAKFQIFIERVLHSSYFFIFICRTKSFLVQIFFYLTNSVMFMPQYIT